MTDTVRFDYDKNGRKVAYRWMRIGRWCKMSLAEAELLEATETVPVVYYGPNFFKPGHFEFTTIRQTDRMTTQRITKTSD